MKKRSSLNELFEYAGNYKYLTISSWILSAISAWMALLPFVYIWKIIKEVLEVAPHYKNATQISHNGWMAVLFAVLSMLIYMGGLLCSHLAAFRVQAQIRTKAMHHIVKLPMGVLNEFGSGRLRKIVDESSAATETYLAHQLPDQAGAFATPVGLLLLLVVFDWRLGLLSLIPVVIAFLIMSTMTGKDLQVKMKEYQDALGQMSNEAVEYIRGIPVVKTFGQSVFSFKRFKDSIDRYGKWAISYTLDMRKPMLFYTTIINAVFAVLIAATFFFTADTVTDSFILNLLFYIIVTPVITITLNKIMYASENVMIVKDALNRIHSVLDLEPLPTAKFQQHPKDNGVCLEGVSFKYHEANKDAISNISIKINPGEHIALVGPSGGGKTTLASLIARFWDTDSGKVMIGGADVKSINNKELMEYVSFVFQDSGLLKTSIFENVRMSKPDANRQQVEKALHDAQCDDIIEKLSQGIDTVVGSKGVYLSGGEQQRIAIARVMLKKSPILILDEATAFADPDNEAKVQKAFSELSKGKTVIMIAHRLSTVTGCDKIYVIKDGTIAESGAHTELLEKNAIYAHMWNEYGKAANWKVGVVND